METHRRKADGRRVFTPQFKQEQVARLSRQELTVSELARELAVSPQLIRQWQRLSAEGSTAAVTANEDVVPASALRVAQQRIRELERALGNKVIEIEILQAARPGVARGARTAAGSSRTCRTSGGAAMGWRSRAGTGSSCKSPLRSTVMIAKPWRTSRCLAIWSARISSSSCGRRCQALTVVCQ